MTFEEKYQELESLNNQCKKMTQAINENLVNTPGSEYRLSANGYQQSAR